MPSSKALHKLNKSAAHGNDGSHTDLQSKRNSSATNLRKNSSHVSLKRNRSAAEVTKRPKSSNSNGKEKERKEDKGQPTSAVHFEIGDQDDGAWEEASSSASPALSRAPSRSGPSSAKLSANNSHASSPRPSRPQSPVRQEAPPPANGSRNHNADAKIITERLLQRTPSHITTTAKMSLATALPSTSSHSPDSPSKNTPSTSNGTAHVGSKEDVVSRFVAGSGTPSDNSHYLQQLALSKRDEVKRAQSMGNLTRHDSSARETDEESDSALLPRSRKSSTTHAYNPPQQSRTQQKLWLQRASSNIEPAQLAAGVGINGMGAVHGGFGSTSLVGAGYDGKDPRIKLQLERTGLEYLVVRRHQDPIGLALKRLNQLPGAEKYRRIPPQSSHSSRKSDGGNGSVGRYGLSQSMRDSRGGASSRGTTVHGSFEGDGEASLDGLSGGEGDDGLNGVLRSMWDKSFDLSASAD